MKRVLLMACYMASLLATSTLVATSSLAADTTKAKVYTWTDDKGVIHYGERPPKDVNAKLVKTRTGHSEPVPQAAPPKPEEAVAETQQQMQRVIDPERCELARKNLRTMDGHARIKVPDEQGNLRYLTEQEKAEKRQEMEQIVSESCE